jgi:hypothetical protein
MSCSVVDITGVSGESTVSILRARIRINSPVYFSEDGGSTVFGDARQFTPECTLTYPRRRYVNTVVPAMGTSYLKVVKNFPRISILGKIE